MTSGVKRGAQMVLGASLFVAGAAAGAGVVDHAYVCGLGVVVVVLKTPVLSSPFSVLSKKPCIKGRDIELPLFHGDGGAA